jgi:DNA polymerase-3 subunit alpha
MYIVRIKSVYSHKINELTPTRRGVTTVFAGLVVDVANFPNRIMITLDDGTARIEVSCNHERFQRLKILFKMNKWW